MVGISVVGVADPATDKAEALVAETGGAAFADHRIMLEKAKPDAVWISSPCWLHAQHTVDCLEAGAGEKSGGIVFEWEIHEIDFCRYLGGEVSHVYARTAHSRPEAPTFLDHFTAVLTFANGAYGNLEASQSCHLSQGERYFVGTRGTAKAVGANQIRIKTLDMAEPETITVEDDGKSNQFRQDEDFVQALLEGRSPPVPGWDGRINIEIGLAIIESGRTGEVVKLPMG